MAFGFHNKILRVDLTQQTIAVEEPGELFYRKYLGGLAIICYYLLRETPPHIDPLGPQNKLIFATGPLTGITTGGSGRNSVGARSPLTGALGSSEMGGYWGAELKKAGFDAIIIEGQSSEPVYLWVHDGVAEIRPAKHLWGLENLPAHRLIQEEIGQKNARISQCGPAGENLVLYANIMADLSHSAGRTGLGAVMGSKKLKAIAVWGSNKLPVYDSEKILAMAQWMVKNHKSMTGSLSVFGTGGSIPGYNRMKVLPTNNYQLGYLEGAEQVAPAVFMEQIGKRMGSCFSCPVRCKKEVEMKEPYPVDPAYGGPEYETIGSVGTACGVNDLAAVAKASERLNALGMDSMSCGMTIAWAMEAYEKGLLGPEDTGGKELRFGDGEAMLELIEDIACRRGIGDLLALGSKKAAERLGKNSIEFAMQVKGLEIPMHDPRLQHGLGLGYALSYTGADHNHNVFDIDYANVKEMKDLYAMGILEDMHPQSLGPEKVRAYAYGVLRPNLNNILGMCNFLPYTDNQIAELLAASTGWNCSLWELMKGAERGLTMARAYNAREGFTAKDDTLPKRFFESVGSEGSVGKPLDAEALQEAVQLYYQMMGWEPQTGRPTRARLEELGIGWVDQVLNAEKP
jgi:aldehyde:ferredoxin oxidoreductase